MADGIPRRETSAIEANNAGRGSEPEVPIRVLGEGHHWTDWRSVARGPGRRDMPAQDTGPTACALTADTMTSAAATRRVEPAPFICPPSISRRRVYLVVSLMALAVKGGTSEASLVHRDSSSSTHVSAVDARDPMTRLQGPSSERLNVTNGPQPP